MRVAQTKTAKSLSKRSKLLRSAMYDSGGGEGTEGMKLGLKLAFVAAIIVIALAVFLIGQSMANKGMTNISEAVSQADVADFQNYNLTQVVGSTVMSAVDKYAGKPVALVIATTTLKNRGESGGIKTILGKTGENSLKGGGAGTPPLGSIAHVAQQLQSLVAGNLIGDGSAGGGGVKTGITKTSDKWILANGRGTWSGVTTQGAWVLPAAADDTTAGEGMIQSTKTAKGDQVPLVYKAYNAVLESKFDDKYSLKDSPDGVKINATTYAYIYWSEDHYVAPGGFVQEDGRTKYSSNVKSCKVTGSVEYVQNGARFNAYLIKDAGDNIIGAAFDQVGR
jgi:hypothetical protein